MDAEEVCQILKEAVESIDTKSYLWNKVMNNDKIKQWIGSSKEREKFVREGFEKFYEDFEEG